MAAELFGVPPRVRLAMFRQGITGEPTGLRWCTAPVGAMTELAGCLIVCFFEGLGELADCLAGREANTGVVGRRGEPIRIDAGGGEPQRGGVAIPCVGVTTGTGEAQRMGVTAPLVLSGMVVASALMWKIWSGGELPDFRGEAACDDGIATGEAGRIDEA